MRMFLALFLMLALATPSFAGGCQDTQSAAQSAMKARNGKVTDMHNVLIPDPEDERGWLFDILGSVNIFGDGFSLGITFPSLQQIVGNACKTVDHQIQAKISQAQAQLVNSVPTIGGYNPLTVNANTDYITPLSRKLK